MMKQADKLEVDELLAPPSGGAVTAFAVTERALSAPYGGTSPKGRGKWGCLTTSDFPDR